MNKEDVKRILRTLGNAENEAMVNYLLGKIDIMDEKSFTAALESAGNTEEGVKQVLSSKIEQMKISHNDEKIPINDMITYGISGNSIHLHLPGKLQQMLGEIGPRKTMDTVNLYLLDAIDRIVKMQDSGFSRFQGKDVIYMISPILITPELNFLESMDFEAKLYKKKDLQDENFVLQNPEAKLANHIFGNQRNVGTARLLIEKAKSKQWQEKKKQKVQEFSEKGITILDSDRDLRE